MIFFDSYGVLRNHRGLIPGPVEAITRLRAAGKHIRVLTNNAARNPGRGGRAARALRIARHSRH